MVAEGLIEANVIISAIIKGLRSIPARRRIGIDFSVP